MGNSLYCFSNQNKNNIIIKSDLNLRKIESNYEFHKNDTNVIMNSNLKSVNSSPKYEQKNIIVNPIPEVVILKPRKK
jgi:hypothetical protein